MGTHAYVLEPGSNAAANSLVLLHGSEGAEVDLLSFAARVAPGATRLGVRGSLALGRGYAFFGRFADRRIDEADIALRVPALSALIHEQIERGHLSTKPVVAGFSNGAIMAAALVATDAELFSGAVLLRPISPFSTEDCYRPATLPVLIVDGAADHRRSARDGSLLAQRLTRAGAAVDHHVLPAGHSVTAEDEHITREWLKCLPTSDEEPG